MGEYYGFHIDEGSPGEFQSLLDTVDPYYHRAICFGISVLCEWYGDKAYREVEGDWFTAILGTVLEMEKLLVIERERNRTPEKRDWSFVTAKEKND